MVQPQVQPQPSPPSYNQILGDVVISLNSPDTFCIYESVDKRVVDILQSTPGTLYGKFLTIIFSNDVDASSRAWIFPAAQYYSVVNAIQNIGTIEVKLPPKIVERLFVQRERRPEGEVHLEKIPTQLLNKLMPFQRTGVM